MSKCVDQSIGLLDIATELGAEVVMSGDDIADNRRTMISPLMWETIFLPHFRRYVTAIHDHGLYYWKHTDGNIMEVLDGLVDSGIDGIDPIDPLAKMDLATVKQKYGDRVAIKGNVDCAYLLVDGLGEGRGRVGQELHPYRRSGRWLRLLDQQLRPLRRPARSVRGDAGPPIREYGVYPLDMDRLNS